MAHAEVVNAHSVYCNLAKKLPTDARMKNEKLWQQTPVRPNNNQVDVIRIVRSN
jgi:hypothetical protein